MVGSTVLPVLKLSGCQLTSRWADDTLSGCARDQPHEGVVFFAGEACTAAHGESAITLHGRCL